MKMVHDAIADAPLRSLDKIDPKILNKESLANELE
jgi:hypothetical protein